MPAALSAAAEETYAADVLHGLGFGPLVREPNGFRTWPDFVLGDDTSVEVRRLCQVYLPLHTDGGGREYNATPFLDTVSKVLDRHGTAADATWFVDFDVTAPVERAERELAAKRLKLLLAQVHDADQGPYVERLTQQCSVQIFRGSHRIGDNRFLVAGPPDPNIGGFVVGELINAVNHCIGAKSILITPQYPTHWLVLVDHSGLFWDVTDMMEAWKHVRRDHPFARVFVLHRSRSDIVFDSLVDGSLHADGEIRHDE